MMDPAGLQVPAITQNTRTFPIADRLQQDPVDFVPWLKRVRRHAAKQNSLFRDGNLYMNKDNQPAGTPPDYHDNPQAFSELTKMRTKQSSNYTLLIEAAEGNSLAARRLRFHTRILELLCPSTDRRRLRWGSTCHRGSRRCAALDTPDGFGWNR